MNPNPENLRELPSVKQFAAAAEQFCKLLENHANFTPYEFMRQIAISLTRLYGAGLELPEVDCSTFGDNFHISRNEVSREKIRGIGGSLGEFNDYGLVFNPYDEKDRSELPISFSISEDLSEIYDDLQAALTEFCIGNDQSICEAVWHWQFGYESHWGYHAIHALGAIHWLITSDVVGFHPRDETTYKDEE